MPNKPAYFDEGWTSENPGSIILVYKHLRVADPSGMEDISIRWTKVNGTIGIISHPEKLEEDVTRDCPFMRDGELGYGYTVCAKDKPLAT